MVLSDLTGALCSNYLLDDQQRLEQACSRSGSRPSWFARKLIWGQVDTRGADRAQPWIDQADRPVGWSTSGRDG
jgi:hypothetical protein